MHHRSQLDSFIIPKFAEAPEDLLHQGTLFNLWKQVFRDLLHYQYTSIAAFSVATPNDSAPKGSCNLPRKQPENSHDTIPDQRPEIPNRCMVDGPMRWYYIVYYIHIVYIYVYIYMYICIYVYVYIYTYMIDLREATSNS